MTSLFSKLLFCAALLASATGAPAAARPVRSGMMVERIVMVMRHGVRAPLEGEVPPGTRTSALWPAWPVAPGRLTAHGAAALTLQGQAERGWLAARGLIAMTGCPAPAQIAIWANTADRTIASGEAFARGLAPGCGVAVGHRDAEVVDPLFEPLRAGSPGFDARAAVAAIDRATGGMDRLARRQHAALRLLDRVLGCAEPGHCDPGGMARIVPDADGRGVTLSGPVRTASGTAQVLLLEYAEGMPMRDVGWGRADARTLRRLGALHAALFDVFTRSPYMAAHQAGPIGRHIIGALTEPGAPGIDVLVGHDTNVTALAAALHVPLAAPGYAPGDVAPGGALVLELLRDLRDARRYVRLSLHDQSPAMIRTLGPVVTRRTLRIPGCSIGSSHRCPLPRFVALLAARLAPTS